MTTTTTTVQLEIAKIMDAISGVTGSTGPPVDPKANSLEFVLDYELKLDGVRFDQHRYRHWVPVYEDEEARAIARLAALGLVDPHETRRMLRQLRDYRIALAKTLVARLEQETP